MEETKNCLNGNTTSAAFGEKRRRIAYFDALKCLGIILVIEGHVRGHGFGYETYDSISTLMFYAFNMPIFFFVSGFLAYKVEPVDIKQLASKIWDKMVYLLFPAFVFYVVRKLYLNEDPLGFVYNGLGGYWFTNTLFWCFFIFYVVKYFIHYPKYLLLTLALISVVGLIYLTAFSRFDIELLDLNRVAKYFPFFILGVASKMHMDFYALIMKNELLRSIAVIAFFLLLIFIGNGYINGFLLKVSRVNVQN